MRPLLGEHVIGASVVDQPLVFEVQNTTHRAVQKFAVVADDQHGVRIFDQIGLEPERAFEVEIVGRFVEQQEVRFGEEDRRKGHPHAPAAGKGRTGHLLFFMCKAQTLEDRCGAGFGRPGLDIGKPCLHLGDAGGVGGGFRLGQQRLAFGIGAQHGVDQRDLVTGDLLADTADFPAFGNRDIAGVQHHFAPDDPEQGRLARAVTPHKTHFMPRGDGDGCVFDQRTAFDGVCDI